MVKILQKTRVYCTLISEKEPLGDSVLDLTGNMPTQWGNAAGRGSLLFFGNLSRQVYESLVERGN